MNKRDAYRRSYEARVRATGPKVQDFTLYIDHLPPWERLRLKPQIDTVQLLLARLAMRLHLVTVATEADWEEARDQAEGAWADFQRAVDEAYAQMYASRPAALVRSLSHDSPPTPATQRVSAGRRDPARSAHSIPSRHQTLPWT